MESCSVFDTYIVSIHAPARRATMNYSSRQQDDVVSIHAPARRATPEELRLAQPDGVSIHAPARRATAPPCNRLTRLEKFQSTPPHGGRPRGAWRRSWHVDLFQSTPPHGGRRARVPAPGPADRPVSIHAPARRATLRALLVVIGYVLFQSTPPHGGRRYLSEIQRRLYPGFNPRPRTEGDVGGRSIAGSPAHVSIHAPARRATIASVMDRSRKKKFQSTPPHGGRPGDLGGDSGAGERFNPRPRTEGDSLGEPAGSR